MAKRQRDESNRGAKPPKTKAKIEEGKDSKAPKKSKPFNDGKSRQQSTSSNTNDINNSNKMKNKKSSSSSSKGGGLDEIDSLFAHKKQSNQKLQQQIQNEKQIAKEERARRKQARLEEEAEEMALRGGATGVSGVSPSAAATAAGKRKGDATAPQALQAKAKKLPSLTYSRSDILELNHSDKKEAKDVWASDGLGGIFNGEGYTGRRDDGGHRVFKAHLMNKKDFGKTKDCPFDCDCCFI
mmetsp:Transcript_7481/g.14944  ORF Transcript_7481/g.14944 Transcript_7481/m.14944 type:complete len:240 (-) Transcript_7481:2385-3104(-)